MERPQHLMVCSVQDLGSEIGRTEDSQTTPRPWRSVEMARHRLHGTRFPAFATPTRIQDARSHGQRSHRQEQNGRDHAKRATGSGNPLGDGARHVVDEVGQGYGQEYACVK